MSEKLNDCTPRSMAADELAAKDRRIEELVGALETLERDLKDTGLMIPLFEDAIDAALATERNTR